MMIVFWNGSSSWLHKTSASPTQQSSLTAAVSRKKANTRSARSGNTAALSRKIANCQQGVFLAYAASRGYTFLERRLYLPEAWFDKAHAAKRKKCGVPKDLVFQTEPELGLEMLTELKQRGVVPFAWVNADEHYGMNPDFLAGVAGLDKWYFAEVPCPTLVWPEKVKILPAGLGQAGNLKAGRPRSAPARCERRTSAARSSANWRRAADGGLETFYDQGRRQRPAHCGLRLCPRRQ